MHEKTNEARAMGLAFGPDWDLYIVDNQGWSGDERLKYNGRILRVRMNGDKIEKVTVVAEGMEHPNGIRIKGEYMYVTQSTMENVKTKSGELLSCVYRFHLDDKNIHITNTLNDKNIFATWLTHNPNDQYGVDGIVFDHEGNLYIGNFGDGEVFKLYATKIFCFEQGNQFLLNAGFLFFPLAKKSTYFSTIILASTRVIVKFQDLKILKDLSSIFPLPYFQMIYYK